jgi:hypothetical protein
VKVTKVSRQVPDWAFRRVASHPSIYDNGVFLALSEKGGISAWPTIHPEGTRKGGDSFL